MQWLRIHLAMQGTQTQTLVRELRPQMQPNKQIFFKKRDVPASEDTLRGNEISCPSQEWPVPI